MIATLRLICLLFVSLLIVTPAFGLDAFEIQVYDAEIDKPQVTSLETHLNTVVSGQKESDSPALLPSDHLTHLTFEGALGMTRFWETGFYFQAARTSDNLLYYAGVKWRNKFVVPRDVSGPWHLGVNLEVSTIPERFDDSAWGGEIRPIVGFEDARWQILFNPILELAFSTPGQTPSFEPAFKIRLNTGYGFGIGPEYYARLGEVNHIPSFGDQTHLLFLALDLLDSKYEWNIGVGRGLTESADPWTLKTIFGFEF